MALPVSFEILAILSLLPLSWLLYERGRALLMFFQQEEYSYTRFIVWWASKLAVDRLASGVYLIVLVAGLMDAGAGTLLVVGSVGLLLAPFVGVIVSRAALKDAKKPLVMTARATRILMFFIFFGFLFAAIGAAAISFGGLTEESAQLAALAGYTFALIQALPFVMILADIALKPMEARIKNKYLMDAKNKLAVLNPTVIAITGSFGKTSTKQILCHILGSSAPTLATPGSVNTEMGITRIIREQLRPEHRYFIVEMGAYGPGSIARLCRLTPPHASMVTAVGAAHYERFKTLKAVSIAKFEIAEATIATGGFTVVSQRGVPDDLRKERMAAVDTTYYLMGPDGPFELVSSRQDAQGIEVVLKDHHHKEEGKEAEEITLRAPVFGLHQAENVAMAASMARLLGLPWAVIKAALRNSPQTRHRLEVFKTPGAPTILDDAYNSNPRGFKEALEVLGLLAKPDGKRICITPGMVELGAIHDEEHARLGKIAAKACSHIMVVTPDRIPTFVKAIETSPDGAILETFATQAEAEAAAKSIAGDGDAILFENNLPDLYEARVRF